MSSGRRRVLSNLYRVTSGGCNLRLGDDGWVLIIITYASDRTMYSMSSWFVINLLYCFKRTRVTAAEKYRSGSGFSTPNSGDISSGEYFCCPIKKGPKNAEAVFITYRQRNFAYISVGVHLQSARTRGTFCYFSLKNPIDHRILEMDKIIFVQNLNPPDVPSHLIT